MPQMDTPKQPEGAWTALSLDERGTPTVSVFGEIDLFNVSMLEWTLFSALCQSQSECLIVDLRGVEFIDLVGIKSLLRTNKDLDLLVPGGRLLVACDERVAALIELLGVEDRLQTCPEVTQAHKLCLAVS